MPETIILDPVEVSTGRTQLDISDYVKAEGVDWGDGAIEQFLADRERGSAPVDFRIPNRQIVLPLNVKSRPGGITFVQARQNLQAKVARVQQEGGWIKRTTASGALFADLTSATLKFGGSWMQGRTNAPVDTEAELQLEAIPDWYGAEITLADRVDTSNGDLIWTETNILGNYPGRLRLVVDDDQGINQQGLIFGIRSRHYSSSTTAALRYFGSTLTPLDAATSSGSGITHSSLSTLWTPVCSTDQAGVPLTHTGTYRVWARCSTSTPTKPHPRVRLLWDVGDFALPTENPPAQLSGFNNTYSLDLGEVRLDRAPSGTHRWRGVIQAAGTNGGENVSVDRLWLVPVDEGYGVLRAPINVDPGLNPYVARDEFNQTAGALTTPPGKGLPVGGTWAGAGDTDDFVVEATGHTAQRTAGGDVTTRDGRFALAGTGTYAAIVEQVDFKRGSYTNRNNWTGVIARYGSATTFLFAGLAGGSNQPGVEGYVASSAVVSHFAASASPTAGTWYTVRLMVDTTGRYLLWFFPTGGAPGNPVISGQDADLATGGSLASGRIGFFDSHISPIGAVGSQDIRNFDNFAAWAPQQDAVLFASQSAELRTEGMFREDPTGAAYGPVSHVTGDLPRIPPSGAEGRTTQFILKASRGDLDTLPDIGVDDISARVAYRPSYLLTN